MLECFATIWSQKMDKKYSKKGLHRAELEYFFVRLLRKAILYLAFIPNFVYS
jgi:hypothetical protein